MQGIALKLFEESCNSILDDEEYCADAETSSRDKQYITRILQGRNYH